MKHFKVGLLSAIALFAGATGANALVLCVNASGSVTALPACKAGTTQLDIVATGLQGPAGPAGPGGPAGPAGLYRSSWPAGAGRNGQCLPRNDGLL